jgi:hypothetical protein
MGSEIIPTADSLIGLGDPATYFPKIPLAPLIAPNLSP